MSFSSGIIYSVSISTEERDHSLDVLQGFGILARPSLFPDPVGNPQLQSLVGVFICDIRSKWKCLFYHELRSEAETVVITAPVFRRFDWLVSFVKRKEMKTEALKQMQRFVVDIN